METRAQIKAQRQRKSQRVRARLRETVPVVLACYPVDAAYIYGSAARGTMTPLSDVDIALVLSTSMPPYERLKLELTLQGKIEDACGLSPIDVRAINEAPLLVKGRVVQEGVLIYEGDHDRRVAFEVATRKRYFDFAPMAERLQAAFLEHIHRRGLLGQSKNPKLDSE